MADQLDPANPPAAFSFAAATGILTEADIGQHTDQTIARDEGVSHLRRGILQQMCWAQARKRQWRRQQIGSM